MYKCKLCGSMFSEPDSIRYCNEDYCGVASLFPTRTYSYYDACPYCGSEDINSYWEDEDDEYE